MLVVSANSHQRVFRTMRAHLRSEDLPAKDIDNYCHVFPDFLKKITLLIGWDYFEQDAMSLVRTEAKRRNDM